MTQIEFDFSLPLPSWAKKLAVFDLETTGLDLREARIVTACVMQLDEAGEITEGQEWLANPEIEIPAAAAAVHGVTTELAIANGRNARDVTAEIIDRLRSYFDAGIPVVAYNAPYDFTILHFEALRHGLEPISNPAPIIDPLVIDKFKDPYRGGKRRLENAAQFYSIPLENAHNSTADAVAAGRVAQAIAKRWAEELAIDASELHRLQIDWSDANDASFESYMRRVKDPEFTVVRGWPQKL